MVSFGSKSRDDFHSSKRELVILGYHSSWLRKAHHIKVAFSATHKQFGETAAFCAKSSAGKGKARPHSMKARVLVTFSEPNPHASDVNDRLTGPTVNPITSTTPHKRWVDIRLDCNKSIENAQFPG